MSFLPIGVSTKAPSASQQAANRPAPQFGRIYGILGDKPKALSKNAPFPIFPAGQEDNRVKTVIGRMQAEAEAAEMPFDTLVITRTGAPNNGVANVCRELRLVFTDMDATTFKEKKNKIEDNLKNIEKLQADHDKQQSLLQKLNEQRSSWDYTLYNTLGFSLSGKSQDYALIDASYKAVKGKLNTLDIFAKNMEVVYQSEVKPLLRAIKQSIDGYIPVETVESLLNKNEFDIRNGSEHEFPPYAFWWFKTDA